MKDLAFKASDPFVPKDRWIATLSSGHTVFQDVIPNQISAWRRLQKVVKLNGWHITNLRLQAYGHNIAMPPCHEVSGYWQASRISKLVNFPEIIDRGIGYIQDNILHITWISSDGTLTQELRTYDSENDLAGILHAKI
jgi:hypothetical protein